MKKIFQLAVILLAFVPVVCFGQKEKTQWAEMKAFHTLMAASFHPAEEGNFAPLKAKAEELFNAAKTWQKSEIPSGFKPAETKDALRKLVIECGAVHKAVLSNKSDEELKRMITAAHDIFHTIVGECRNAE